MPVSKEFQRLDDERRAIQARINARGILHKKADKLPFDKVIELQNLVRGFDVHDDAERYVEIQDLQWEMWGVHIKTTGHRADHNLPE